MVKTAVLVSGQGTNLQALLDARVFGEIPECDLAAVISSNPSAYSLVRARNAGVPSYVIDRDVFPNAESFNVALAGKLRDLDIELVVLAGFMHIVDKRLVRLYKNKMINIHPSLIPAFCGKGYYGLRVHQAVLDYGVKYTGATVHFVTEDPDAGPIIMQQVVEVNSDDSAESLQFRVMEKAEWKILPRAVDLFCRGKLDVRGRKVRILEEDDIG